MAYIKGQDRHQRTLFPDCIDDYIEEDAPVRLLDVFIDRLDLDKLGFVHTDADAVGHPPYDPRDLLKIYVYGYYYSVRSSRQLARQCKCNIELMWLVNRLTPDFRTISDFRKDNVSAITGVFKEFNKYCYMLGLFNQTFISIDGSKFKASNAKDRNFTLSKLDDRIKRLDTHIANYLSDLEANDLENDGDRELSIEEINQKLQVCEERRAKYIALRDKMESEGLSQVSLSDADARLMKQNEGFCVGYNTQTAVDAESHLIVGYKVTNNPTDHGQITPLASEVKDDFGTNTLEAVADKGYQDPEDMAEALANGIVPNVITRDGSTETDVVFDYVENDITAEEVSSNNPTDIKKCLESGVVPAIYRGILSDPEIIGQRHYQDTPDAHILKMTPDEMLLKAKEGFFVRDAVRNLVYCPEGCILRQKSTTKKGDIRYANRLACKGCSNKCTQEKFKVTQFSKDNLIIRCKSRSSADEPQAPKPKRKQDVTIVRKVKFKLKLDAKKMDQRKCLSEHPFGTIKRSLNSYYFLLRSKVKVEAEMALFCLSYNIRRAINLVGTSSLRMAMG